MVHAPFFELANEFISFYLMGLLCLQMSQKHLLSVRTKTLIRRWCHFDRREKALLLPEISPSLRSFEMTG